MINKVILLGNVGADPEIRTFEDGNKVARLRIATTEKTYNPKTQERGEKTQWHTVIMWRGLAGIAEQYVRKGSQLYIEGKLNYTEWNDGNNQKRYGVEVVADEMKMIGSRRESQGQTLSAPQQYSNAPQSYGVPQQPQQPQQSFNQPQQSFNQPQQSFNQPQQSFNQPQQPQSAQPATAAYVPDDEDLPF